MSSLRLDFLPLHFFHFRETRKHLMTPDLVEVLVFSMVDIRRAKASATRLPEPPGSSLAVVSSYSSGSTPKQETRRKVTEVEAQQTKTYRLNAGRSKPVRVTATLIYEMHRHLE